MKIAFYLDSKFLYVTNSSSRSHIYKTMGLKKRKEPVSDNVPNGKYRRYAFKDIEYYFDFAINHRED